MRAYKVLHLIDSAGMYGAERVLLTLLDELKESPFPGIAGCIKETVSEMPRIAQETRKRGISTEVFSMNRGFNPKGILQIANYLKHNDIRIVHSHGYKPNIFLAVAPRNRIRALSTVHGWSKQSATIRGKIYEFIDGISLRRMDRIIAVSKAVSKDLTDRGVKREKIEVIYNGIAIKETHVDHLIKAGSSESYGQQATVTLGAIGRITAVKGYQYLIEAMPFVLSAIPDCRLLIAGDGPMRDELSRKISLLGLDSHITFVGYQDSTDRFLSTIDVFVMPSLSEGLPMALLEAMACKKPIVASSVGGIPEVINDGENGILVPPANPEALSLGILKLCTDRYHWARMSQKAKELVEKSFSSRNMAEQYVALYSRFMQ